MSAWDTAILNGKYAVAMFGRETIMLHVINNTKYTTSARIAEYCFKIREIKKIHHSVLTSII